MAAAPRRFGGEFYVGGQEHFYLEGQVSYAMPKEDGCIHLYCSTQHPTDMQNLVAHALDLDANQVIVEMRPPASSKMTHVATRSSTVSMYTRRWSTSAFLRSRS